MEERVKDETESAHSETQITAADDSPRQAESANELPGLSIHYQWTCQEENRLWDLREENAQLTWEEFCALYYFPNRTRVSLKRKYSKLKRERPGGSKLTSGVKRSRADSQPRRERKRQKDVSPDELRTSDFIVTDSGAATDGIDDIREDDEDDGTEPQHVHNPTPSPVSHNTRILRELATNHPASSSDDTPMASPTTTAAEAAAALKKKLEQSEADQEKLEVQLAAQAERIQALEGAAENNQRLKADIERLERALGNSTKQQQAQHHSFLQSVSYLKSSNYLPGVMFQRLKTEITNNNNEVMRRIGFLGDRLNQHEKQHEEQSQPSVSQSDL
ncbi:uncharacterized protein DSM5745_00800 [Aspergillus mulundensis]|uniref:Myb-like domain-containing protein n=1 Tax=Aspergillus mulundensis TaxID=1810919 RepID=A0A3D8T640_9EURO|nr:hypothetical protein DSM5745_00800 [Aspergillus mulundensis]RDW93478.1 hypothetical protein DSM5745_00800 [Aspergillus mulundensis]